MSAAPIPAEAVSAQIIAFQKHAEAELGMLGDLHAKLHPSKIGKIESDWRSLNEEFSIRFKAENTILEECEACQKEIETLPPEEQVPLLKVLAQTSKAFQEHVITSQTAILGSIKVASRTLNKPILIQTGRKQNVGREFPIDLSDVTLQISGGKLVIDIPVKEAKPSLTYRLAKGVWDNIGKIAFVAAAIIIASQTDLGASLLASSADKIAQYGGYAYEPIKQATTTALTTVASVAKNNLPALGSFCSGVWALPNAYRAWRADNKKAAAAHLVLGASMAAIPHLVQPGFTVDGAVDSGLKLAKGLASAAGFKTEL